MICALAATPAAADEDPRADHPWALRGDAFVLGGSRLGGGVGAATASVQRTLFRRFAWEESIGWGPSAWGGGGQPGWTFAGTARAAAWMSADRTHALTGALGTALLTGEGRLSFLFAEAGYEYRGPRGLSLLLAVGPNLLLSRPTDDLCRGDADFCEHFRRGQPAYLGHVRAGAGWAF